MRSAFVYIGISLLSACGGTEQMAGGMDPDPSDMSPDAGMLPDPTPVDHSCSLDTGRASILAVLHNPDGSIKSTKMTDADGQVSWDDCPANALVSYAALDQNGGWHGATVSSVQPGDHFEVILEASDVKSNVLVSIPIDNADVTYIRAQVGGACYLASSEGATADVKLRTDCLRGSGAVPVLASGKIGSVPVFSYGSAAAMVEGGQTIVNNMTPWMTGPQMNLSASNIPGAGVSFYASAVVDSRIYGGTAALQNAVAGSASAALALAPSGFATTRRVSVSSTTGSERGIARETSELESSFDMSNVLPEITGITTDDTDPTRPAISVGGDLSAADVGIVFLEWTTNNVPVEWRLLYRASSTSTIAFPEMPAEFTGGAPASVDYVHASVLDVTGSSYADILTRGYHFYEYNHGCPELPAGSECLFVNYTPN